MLYPAISSYWNSRTQSKAIIDYEKMLENIPKEKVKEVCKENLEKIQNGIRDFRF